MTKKTWLAAAGVLGLGAVSAYLLAHGYMESGTLAAALALAGLVFCPLWNWKL